VKYAVEMASGVTIYLPSFMAIGSGIQVILKLYLSNLRGCDINTINGREL
jgi:hypothetical protein